MTLLLLTLLLTLDIKSLPTPKDGLEAEFFVIEFDTEVTADCSENPNSSGFLEQPLEISPSTFDDPTNGVTSDETKVGSGTITPHSLVFVPPRDGSNPKPKSEPQPEPTPPSVLTPEPPLLVILSIAGVMLVILAFAKNFWKVYR